MSLTAKEVKKFLTKEKNILSLFELFNSNALNEFFSKLSTAKRDIENKEQRLLQIEKENAEKIKKVKDYIVSIGLDPKEVEITAVNKSIKKKPQKPIKRAIKYKFIDENNNELLWTGVGKMPTWLKDQIQNGKSKEDFLIKEQ